MHALYGSQTLYPQRQSVLIFPLDQAIHSLVRCKILENVPQGGGFSTEKSEITLPNGQPRGPLQRSGVIAKQLPFRLALALELVLQDRGQSLLPLVERRVVVGDFKHL